jgi:iron complex transport system permease protein
MKLSAKKLNFVIIILIFITAFFYLKTGISSLNIFDSTILNKIIFDIRLPRLFLALIVGAGLAGSGVVFQGLLRNPLAEPYTLGIAGMVVLFVNINLFLTNFFNFNFNLSLTNSFSAFCGAILSIFFIYSVFVKKKYAMSQILLIGIMLNIISMSIVELLSNVMEYTKIYSSKFWLIGNLSSELDFMFYPFAGFVILCIFLFYKKGEVIDILSLGDKHAIYLGINLKKEQKKLFLLASLVAGFCVAYTGIIGFVGLMIPHISRYFVGVNNKKVIVTSSLLGAFYLLFSDFVAKTIFYPKEIPVGVITGFIGGLFFVGLVLKRGNYE